MSKKSDLVRHVEDRIEKHLPKKWTKKEIGNFTGSAVFDLDTKALNENLSIPLSDFVKRGGKRLRPQLYISCLETFGVNYKEYLDLAVVIELIHNATLILDDIEDEGMLRRGKPTLHIKYGLDTAVNSGFLLHILPMRLVLDREKDLSYGKKLKIWNLYYESLVNVGLGQAMDIYWHKHINGDISIRHYLEMARLKTGSLMRMSVGMACIVAGLHKKSMEKFEKFAESLGLAFQIIDDSLDIKNCDQRFGKTYGNDITEGKVSLPVVYAFEKIDSKDKIRLVNILAKHTRDKRDIQKALKIIKESGAVERSLKKANEIIDDAWAKIEKDFSKRYDLKRLKKIAYVFVNRDF
ncbi:polyprenyl synthetase family protein [Candidatus Woesebacteria bacterium]|nr:polyprenyl synthetase family protein [Candidatus Woesebacteria bacterium]